MNLIVEDLLELIQPPCVNPFYGTHTTNVVPRSDLDEERLEKYWRLFSKYPNDFASAVAKMLPHSVDFITYDHLKNELTYEQRTRSRNL